MDMSKNSCGCCRIPGSIIVTSPPYWGLRSYLPAGHSDKAKEIGTESSPQVYVDHLVAVFRSIRRVLKPTGTVWVNLGDSFSRGDRSRNARDADRGDNPGSKQRLVAAMGGYGTGGSAGRPAKNLLMIPARCALAMQDEGWILRSQIIWHKPNPLPWSTQDRPTNSYEVVFLFVQSHHPRFWVHEACSYSDQALTKPPPDYVWIHNETGERRRDDPGDTAYWRRKNLWRGCDYYYDAAGIAEPALVGDNGSYFDRGKTGRTHSQQGQERRDKQSHVGNRLYTGFNARSDGRADKPLTRNKRDVWSIPSAGHSSPETHFAIFPEKLVEPMILAGCPGGGIVLDPFAGSGTTLAVATRLGRNGRGIDLSTDYADLIHQRMVGQLTWAL